MSNSRSDPLPQTDRDWAVHSINIHGVFFERWCQHIVSAAGGWRLDATNYAVEYPPPNGPIRGRESALDIRASRDLPNARISLLIECKKNNPEFIDWTFFRKPGEARTIFHAVQSRNIERETPATGWACETSITPLESSYAVTDEARETKGKYSDLKAGNKTKTSNSSIQEAAYQVALAMRAIAFEDETYCKKLGKQSTPPQMPWKLKTCFPTIVTTAKLFVCDFDPGDVDPLTGEIPLDKANISESASLVYEYPVPRHLQVAPVDTAANFSEGVPSNFTTMDILVVRSAHFPQFLETFYRQEPPVEVADA